MTVTSDGTQDLRDAALNRRARDLGIITDRQRRYFQEQLTLKGWRTKRTWELAHSSWAVPRISQAGRSPVRHTNRRACIRGGAPDCAVSRNWVARPSLTATLNWCQVIPCSCIRETWLPFQITGSARREVAA